MSDWQIIVGDCRETLRELPEASVQTCVTSPPYFGLRDYGEDGQIGMEQAPAEFVASLVGVFQDVRRVLADDGTLWLNLGDSYCSQGGAGGTMSASGLVGGRKRQVARPEARDPAKFGRWNKQWGEGVKSKDLLGIPWMVAFALRADGWYLRQEIIWNKTAPMPESVRDRCTRAHEHLFMLAKSPRYFYDTDAIAEEAVSDHPSGNGYNRDERVTYGGRGQEAGWESVGGKRNRRDVWTLNSEPFPGAHFATFPTKLVEPCVRAGSRAGDMVLDPFSGAGTTGLVAVRNGRRYIGLELNAEYAAISTERTAGANVPLPGLAA